MLILSFILFVHIISEYYSLDEFYFLCRMSTVKQINNLFKFFIAMLIQIIFSLTALAIILYQESKFAKKRSK